MKIELTTNLLPFINVNLYNSELDSEYQLSEWADEDFLADLEEQGLDIMDVYDNEEYNKFIYETACDIFYNEYLPTIKKSKLGIFNGKCIKFYTPKKGYDEQLYFDLYIGHNLKYKWNKYKDDLIKNNKITEFTDFLHKTYKSYDGFISFMPQSIKDIDNIIEINDTENYDRIIAVILTYELKQDDNNYQEMLLEKIEDNKYDYDFFNKTINEGMLIKFNKFIKKL